jgi:hypothetical protein
MDLKSYKSPFTLYDFFGYLIPGLTFGLLSLFCSHFRNGLLRFTDLLKDTGIEINLVTIMILVTISGYIGGHLIAAISSYIFERQIVERVLKYPTFNMFFREKKNKLLFYTKFRGPYGNNFKESYKKKFEKTFHIPFENPNDVFWLSFEYISLHCPIAFSRSINFLNLYGFSRNLSMSFFLSGCFLLFLHDLRVEEASRILWIYTASTFFISFIMFNNYLKMLRRLNDEVFRAFFTHVALKEK